MKTTNHQTRHTMSGQWRVEHGDCLTVMRSLPDQSVDAIVTDPPYGLEFMGKEWDAPWKSAEVVTVTDEATNGIFHSKGFSHGVRFSRGSDEMRAFQAWCTKWAAECLRLLKPGGHLLAFGGSRTYHRLACAIEDAGFEIRDQIMWVYGSGFPKSLDVSKAISKTEASDDARRWQGWGTALKPAHEPIVVARKPLDGTVAETVLAHGTGALNIDATRISFGNETDRRVGTTFVSRGGDASNNANDNQIPNRKYVQMYKSNGRWPANFIHDGSDEVLELFPETAGGARPAKANKSTGEHYEGGWGPITDGERIEFAGGSAARFFYCAKASRAEREAGLDTDSTTRRNHHPTVKPVALMRYLVRLVTPPNGLVLDPFTGSGTTGIAARLESCRFIGIEQSADYIKIAHNRIAHHETRDSHG